MFGGRLTSVVVVVEKSVSVTCSCEGCGSKMGVMVSRLAGKGGGIRRGRRAGVTGVRKPFT